MTPQDPNHFPHLRDDPRCPGRNRTMLLVGREQPTESKAELLTFECSDCGHQSTTTTNQ